MVQTAVIQTLRQARHVIKQMNLQSIEVAEEMHDAARMAYKNVIEQRMLDYIDRYLAGTASKASDDRRNGYYSRSFLTELGNIELMIPRTRTISACDIIQRYARRTTRIEHVILTGFVLGLSTRKVGKTLLHLLGEKVSPTTVSRVAKTLDEAVELFHKRPLQDRYEVLLFDGVVMSRKTGAGAKKRPVLVVMGILKDGKKEIIDYALTASESERECTKFLKRLYKRGLKGEGLKCICVDGGQGMLNALDTVYYGTKVQRCWAHRIRNFENKCKKADWKKVKKGLHNIMNAKTESKARSAARRFANKWSNVYPTIVSGLRDTLDDLLVFFLFKDLKWRKMTRTTNAIERRFREVRRRTRPMGVFSDKTSMDRILYAVFKNENSNQGVTTTFLAVTHNN